MAHLSIISLAKYPPFPAKHLEIRDFGTFHKGQSQDFRGGELIYHLPSRSGAATWFYTWFEEPYVLWIFFGINVGYAQHIPELWSLWEYIIITTSWRVYDVRKNGSRNHHEPPEHWADIAVLKLIDLQSGYRYWKPPENNQNIPKQLGSWQIKDEDFNFSTTCGQAWRMTMVSALVLQHRASLYLIDIRGRSWGLQWFWGVTDVESFPNLWQAMPALAISLQGKC